MTVPINYPSARECDMDTLWCWFAYNGSLVLFHGITTHLNQMVSGLN